MKLQGHLMLCWFVFLMKMAKMKKKAILSIEDDECFELEESLGMEKKMGAF